MGKHIRGAITFPILCTWILFILQFVFMGLGEIWKKINITYLDIIINIILLFSLESIAVFLTLSSRKENYLLYKAAFGISIFNVIFILISIIVSILAFFYPLKIHKIINNEEMSKETGSLKVLIFIGIVLIRLIEIFPLIFIIIYFGKISGEAGTIDNPQDPLMNNNNEEIKY